MDEVQAIVRAVDVEADRGHGEAIEGGCGDGGIAEVLPRKAVVGSARLAEGD